MELKEVKELLKAFDDSGSSYLEIKDNEFQIKLKKYSDTVSVVSNPAPEIKKNSVPQNQATEEVAEKEPQGQLDGEQVLAPLVGVFYAAPSPEQSAYVQVGDKVTKGQVLCLIEAMKMMSEITAPKDGTIKKIYAKNQDVVGFEDPLFLIGD